MADYRAADVESFEMRVGEIRTLESLRQAVVPPYVLIIPFIELPAGIELAGQDNFDEEGVHGCVFTLRAVAANEGVLRVGFRDLRTQDVVMDKCIRVTVY